MDRKAPSLPMELKKVGWLQATYGQGQRAASSGHIWCPFMVWEGSFFWAHPVPVHGLGGPGPLGRSPTWTDVILHLIQLFQLRWALPGSSLAASVGGKEPELSLQGPEVGKVPTKLLEVWTPPSSVIFCATDTGKLCLLGDWNDSCREVRSGSLPISGPRL